eukprot:TRINITY_DN22150_c0_g1_i2.p1 TRINITY_DN22150_c0_g1~~TRINITY_DN22150_c0_g1_i2.p1  ORF type:complete len:202 (+),score=33.98 TRINITY_DN22150_c0_g1_i2:138-743(+)
MCIRDRIDPEEGAEGEMREVCTLQVTKNYADIKIEPNAGEENDANFPRNLHNAAELLLRVGHVESAQRLQQCTSKVFDVYAQGPDGSVTHTIGRACVCWSCGHVGVPRNHAQCSEKSNIPAGKCGHCGEDAQTNFVRITQPNTADVMPWIEVTSDKAVVPLAAPGTIPMKTGGGKVPPNSKCPCGSEKKAKKCCHAPGSTK